MRLVRNESLAAWFIAALAVLTWPSLALAQCPNGGALTQATCGGDVCGCAAACISGSQCLSGCCAGGYCAFRCVCEGDGVVRYFGSSCSSNPGADPSGSASGSGGSIAWRTGSCAVAPAAASRAGRSILFVLAGIAWLHARRARGTRERALRRERVGSVGAIFTASLLFGAGCGEANGDLDPRVVVQPLDGGAVGPAHASTTPPPGDYNPRSKEARSPSAMAAGRPDIDPGRSLQR